ncbi:N-6 DNA methylase [Sphingomonas daechungensis]|uniref:N-6 DNA methylase n=1 Tax=Sphingomonas daechungensis TaxID=1176646 RepID=UPI001CB91C29|nr:N-6 DNA methylase [Sphingomonas daechungensis]
MGRHENCARRLGARGGGARPPALGGLFARGATPTLNEARISNRHFLEALFNLGFIRVDGGLHRINWRDMKTEELGSVYESLLEIRPSLAPNGEFVLGTGKGNARKISGSYYTPDSLVETLLGSALDPVLEKAEANAETSQDRAAAVLDLRVIDPACGSGHFLLGAARRMADRVALWRNPDAGKEEKQAALRDVVSRCIHGTDRNPMAVELAKVALWIESVSPGQPLGFLDANIRCGDALLGCSISARLKKASQTKPTSRSAETARKRPNIMASSIRTRRRARAPSIFTAAAEPCHPRNWRLTLPSSSACPRTPSGKSRRKSADSRRGGTIRRATPPRLPAISTSLRSCYPRPRCPMCAGVIWCRLRRTCVASWPVGPIMGRWKPPRSMPPKLLGRCIGRWHSLTS